MTSPQYGARGDIALYQIAAVIRREWRLIVITMVVLAAAVATYALLTPRTFTSRASFVTSSGETGPPNVAGLAAQFGVQLAGRDAAASPAFYQELVRTRELARAIVSSSYRAGGTPTPVAAPLDRWIDLDEEDPLRRREAAIRWLDDAVDVSVSDKTGMVRLSVTTRDRLLSAQLAQRLLDELNRFNLERRQTQASAERQFAERRLAEVAADLRAAEERQRAFSQRNRSLGSSADLRLQEERIGRDVSRYNQLYASVAQAYEQSKLEEVRDIPVITVVDAPEVPVIPDSRGVALRTVIALLGGAFLGTLLAFAREFRARFAERDDQIATPRTAMRTAPGSGGTTRRATVASGQADAGLDGDDREVPSAAHLR